MAKYPSSILSINLSKHQQQGHKTLFKQPAKPPSLAESHLFNQKKGILIIKAGKRIILQAIVPML